MQHDNQAVRSDRRSDSFATTRWSLVIQAGHASTTEADSALASLCEAYWCPLYSYVRRRVADTNEAQDLTQAFFAELLEKKYVEMATPERGRFRSFLLTSLKHFLSKEWEKAKAQKRGGGRSPISFDFESADTSFRIEPAGGHTPEQLFDRQWAVTLLNRIMNRLADDWRRTGKVEQFEALYPFLVGDRVGKTYREAAAELGVSEAAAKMSVSRMRGRYRELLRDEIAQTVSQPNQIDEEIRNLFESLRL